MTAFINKLKDKTGNQQLPVTHERAVRDDNGTTLESKMQNLEGAMDKAYVASSDNGMGRITLKKNMVSGVNTLTQSMMQATNTIYVIQYDFTLGKDITVPANCILEFEGGSISASGSNDTITGNDTKIMYQGTIFNGVFIAGTWNVPVIRSSMFANCTSQDVVKNVFALQNDNIQNEIIIEKESSNYTVTRGSEVEVIMVGSNTKVVLNGNIELLSNSYPEYRILFLGGKNIQIVGSGYIKGDRQTHTYTEGSTHEHGHGIVVYSSSQNITIDGIEVYDCIGDAIYQKTTCSNIIIKNVHLHHCRRQGITIQGIENIIIENFNIHDIDGAAPSAGIDIEPDKGENATCNRITIRNGIISDVVYGVANSSSLAGDEDRVYKNISLSNIIFKNASFSCIELEYADGVYVDDCSIDNCPRGIVNRCDMIVKGCRINTTSTGVAFLNDKNYKTIIRDCNTNSQNCLKYPNNVIMQSSYAIATHNFFIDGGEEAGAWCDIKDSILNFLHTDGTKACMSIKSCNITCKYIQIGKKTILKDNVITGTAVSSFDGLIIYNGNASGKATIINNQINAGNGIYKYIIKVAPNTASVVYGNEIIGYNYAGRFVDSPVGNYIKDFCSYAAFGDKNQRPTFDPNRDIDVTNIGICFFDTKLGRPIFWNGSAWVYADGTPVPA